MYAAFNGLFGSCVEIGLFLIVKSYWKSTYRDHNDGPEKIFLHKWTGQKILDGPDWTKAEPDKNKTKKDKTGRATDISGPALYAPAPVPEFYKFWLYL